MAPYLTIKKRLPSKFLHLSVLQPCSHLDKGVLVFDKELSQIAQKNGKLNYDRSNSLSQSKEKLKKAIDRYGNKATYLLAGQPNDVEAMKKFLVENKGIEIKQIKLDRFKGLK